MAYVHMDGYNFKTSLWHSLTCGEGEDRRSVGQGREVEPVSGLVLTFVPKDSVRGKAWPEGLNGCNSYGSGYGTISVLKI